MLPKWFFAKWRVKSTEHRHIVALNLHTTHICVWMYVIWPSSLERNDPWMKWCIDSIEKWWFNMVQLSVVVVVVVVVVVSRIIYGRIFLNWEMLVNIELWYGKWSGKHRDINPISINGQLFYFPVKYIEISDFGIWASKMGNCNELYLYLMPFGRWSRLHHWSNCRAAYLQTSKKRVCLNIVPSGNLT